MLNPNFDKDANLITNKISNELNNNIINDAADLRERFDKIAQEIQAENNKDVNYFKKIENNLDNLIETINKYGINSTEAELLKKEMIIRISESQRCLYSAMANYFHKTKDYNQAIDFHKKALKLFKNYLKEKYDIHSLVTIDYIKDIRLIADIYYNLACSYGDKNKAEGYNDLDLLRAARKKFSSALKNYKLSLRKYDDNEQNDEEVREATEKDIEITENEIAALAAEITRIEEELNQDQQENETNNRKRSPSTALSPNNTKRKKTEENNKKESEAKNSNKIELAEAALSSNITNENAESTLAMNENITANNVRSGPSSNFVFFSQPPIAGGSTIANPLSQNLSNKTTISLLELKQKREFNNKAKEEKIKQAKEQSNPEAIRLTINMLLEKNKKLVDQMQGLNKQCNNGSKLGSELLETTNTAILRHNEFVVEGWKFEGIEKTKSTPQWDELLNQFDQFFQKVDAVNKKLEGYILTERRTLLKTKLIEEIKKYAKDNDQLEQDIQINLGKQPEYFKAFDKKVLNDLASKEVTTLELIKGKFARYNDALQVHHASVMEEKQQLLAELEQQDQELNLIAQTFESEAVQDTNIARKL